MPADRMSRSRAKQAPSARQQRSTGARLPVSTARTSTPIEKVAQVSPDTVRSKRGETRLEDSEDRRTPDRSASYSSVESLATPFAYDSSLFSPSLTPPSDTSYEDAISVLAYGRAGAKPKPFHHPTPYPIPPSRSNAHLFHTFDSPKLYPRQIRRMPPALSDDSRGARSAAEDICTVLRLPGQITHVAALVLDYVVNNYELGLFADARLAGAAAVMLAMGMQGWHAGAEKTKRAMGCRDEALLSLCSLWQRHEIAMMRYIYETGSQFSPRST